MVCPTFSFKKYERKDGWRENEVSYYIEKVKKHNNIDETRTTENGNFINEGLRKSMRKKKEKKIGLSE